MIAEFSPEVANQIGYYVYRLIDPRNGQTFYVGKGKENRVFQHVKCAIKYYEIAEDITDNDPLKYKIIKQIEYDGLKVIYVIHRWGIADDTTAKIVEAAVIDCYQGLSNLQSGYHAEHGVTNAEVLQTNLSCKTYDEPTDFKYIIIKVKQSTVDNSIDRYEATRYAWKPKPRNIADYPYVFSVTDGIVKEVYEIHEWYYVPELNRYAFNGEIAPNNIRERFKQMRVPKTYYKRGQASPVLFSKNELK